MTDKNTQPPQDIPNAETFRHLDATAEERKRLVLFWARKLVSGETRIFPGDFAMFRRGSKLGVAVATGEDASPINVHPGQSYTLERDSAVPLMTGNFLTLTVDVDETDLADEVKAGEFADRILSFVTMEGGTRDLLLKNPLEWAERIRMMEGDATSSKMAHALVAEFNLLNRLREVGLLTDVARQYRGPDAGTHDFELQDISLECKSRLHGDRESKDGEMVISNEHQLSRTGKKPLYVVYCPMEEIGDTSLERCVDQFGEPRAAIISKLNAAKFQEGDFYWRKTYRFLGEPKVYEIGDDFPRITPAQFPEGRFPAGITKLVYHVSLRNLPYCPLDAFLEAVAAGRAPTFDTSVDGMFGRQ